VVCNNVEEIYFMSSVFYLINKSIHFGAAVLCKQFKRFIISTNLKSMLKVFSYLPFLLCIYRVSTNDCRVKPALEKKYYCVAFLKRIPNFNLLSTVTSDINGVLFALSIQFSVLIFVLSHRKSEFFNRNCKYVWF
jgi:hypothetical protein